MKPHIRKALYDKVPTWMVKYPAGTRAYDTPVNGAAHAFTRRKNLVEIGSWSGAWRLAHPNLCACMCPLPSPLACDRMRGPHSRPILPISTRPNLAGRIAEMCARLRGRK